MDAGGDDQARRRGAALSCREKRAVQACADRDIEIGVVDNDHRVLAAHFQLHLLAARGAIDGDLAAGGDRSGEAHGGDVLMLDNTCADLRSGSHHKVEDSGRATCLVKNFGQLPGASRGQLGGLHHHRVAIGKRRRQLPGRNGDREVPGGDQADHADSLALDHHIDSGSDRSHGIAGVAKRLSGEELEYLRGAHRLADRLGNGLAFLAGQQPAKLVLALDNQRAGTLQNIMAQLRTCRGPARLGGQRGRYRLIDTRRVAAGIGADHIIAIRRAGVGCNVGITDPFATDIMCKIHACLLYRRLSATQGVTVLSTGFHHWHTWYTKYRERQRAGTPGHVRNGRVRRPSSRACASRKRRSPLP